MIIYARIYNHVDYPPAFVDTSALPLLNCGATRSNCLFPAHKFVGPLGTGRVRSRTLSIRLFGFIALGFSEELRWRPDPSMIDPELVWSWSACWSGADVLNLYGPAGTAQEHNYLPKLG